MTPLVLGWSALAAAAAWVCRPRVGRVAELTDAERPTAASSRSRRSPTLRRALWSAAAALPFLVVFPPAAAFPVAGIWAVPHLRARRAARAFERSVWAELPEAVDLFAVCVGAGLTVSHAVDAVGARSGGAIGTALREVRRRVDSGVRLGDALADVPGELGEAVRPIVLALVAAERYGTPLGSTLERVAAEVRLTRRRRAEEEARKVPVRLLFPLVTCVLPAFALLTVVPIVAGSVSTLDLG